ncbi:hypothetical protein [Paenibacillus sp. DR312]|uniref:hypothetical protein n=1 Tax=unclassified Paenibacillus TaxID=185978 RepID=UPI001C95C5E9|nr:hypothetical protein [Paenibacillus sp. DR312]QZN76201.1 hypothetical protein K5K90_02515 [Paenibacillus sp. DR312]
MDYQQQFIKIIADEEECVFIIPIATLKQANIAIGDNCIVVAEHNKIIIKAAGEDR